MEQFVPIMSLWLPILLSAVVVFVVSAIIHMFLGYHFDDFKKAPEEAKLMDALRAFNIQPGEYVVPKADTKQGWKTKEFQDKMAKGPAFLMTMWPAGEMKMGGQLVQWFIFSIVVGIFAAYVAGRALGPGADYLHVFRFAGVTAFACYAISGWSDTIWYKRSIRRTIIQTFDGLVYGLLTAGVFGWLWPR